MVHHHLFRAYHPRASTHVVSLVFALHRASVRSDFLSQIPRSHLPHDAGVTQHVPTWGALHWTRRPRESQNSFNLVTNKET